MKFPRNVRVFKGQLDASPFVGVLFLLVIFILLNSALVFTPGIPLQLPEATGWPGPTNATVIVALDQRGQLYFENRVTKEDELQEQLAQAAARYGAPLTMVLLADRAVPGETIVRLATTARQLGIDTVWATRPPPVPPRQEVP